MLSKVAVFNPGTGRFSIADETLKSDVLQPHQVLIGQTAIAVNEIDVADAKIRKWNNLGYTACGEVEKCGEEVTWLKPRDRVVYLADTDSYRQYKIIDQAKLVKVPEHINTNLAAAVFYRGAVAHMSTVRAFIVRNGINVLVDGIHTPASSALGWMAKKRGAFVVGLTSENHAIPSEVCDVVVRSSAENGVADIMNAFKGIGAHLYFPSLERMSTDKLIEVLAVSAVIVDHLGVMTDLSVDQLRQKSLFLTAPSMMDYKTMRSELVLTVDEIVCMLNERNFPISFSEYKFDQINEAFSQVSSGKSSSAVIVKP